MTLYEELYNNTTNLSKFYRFEGFNSYPYFNYQNRIGLAQESRYIYFSGGELHHIYYVSRRLKQLINRKIIKDTGYKLNKKDLLDSTTFKEIERLIENYPVENKLLSIEFSFLSIMNEMIARNFINNRQKIANDRRIERVDHATIGKGGYGLCDEWLKVFDLLTIFYSYQRITTENILDFLHIYRRNLIGGVELNPVSFLFEPQNRVVKINTKIYSDFSKYELMDALQKIVEYHYYFPNSIFSENSPEKIKRIIQEYNQKRDEILYQADSIYKRELKK